MIVFQSFRYKVWQRLIAEILLYFKFSLKYFALYALRLLMWKIRIIFVKCAKPGTETILDVENPLSNKRKPTIAYSTISMFQNTYSF